MSNPGGNPRPSSRTSTSRPRGPGRNDRSTSERSRIDADVGVLDGVLQELGDHERQRRRDVGVEVTSVAGHPDDHFGRVDDRVPGELDERRHDLAEGHLRRRFAGKHLVDDGDGAHPALRLDEGVLARAPAPSVAIAGATTTRWSAGCSSHDGAPRGSRRPSRAAVGLADGGRSRRAATSPRRRRRPPR